MARKAAKEKEGMGARVEALRKKKGWTQEELAKMLYTGRESLKNKELGIRPFTLAEANTLCDLFDVTLDELVNGVTTKSWDIHKDLGLDDAAISALRSFKEISDPEMQKCLNKVLAFRSALQALAQFMTVPFEEENLSMCESVYYPNEHYFDCKMSPNVYDSVLSYHLIGLLKMIRTDQYMEMSTPLMTAEQTERFLNTLGINVHGDMLNP